MKLKHSTISTILMIILILNLIPLINEHFIVKKVRGNPDGLWTVMLYFCADTRNEEVTGIDNSGNYVDWELSLARSGIIGDIASGTESELNVLLLYDYPYSPSQPNGHAILYRITSGVQTELANWGATNMGDGGTLAQFINYCKTNYPANYYALFLSDHGRGYAGICYDYHAPHPYLPYALGDCLELSEIETALSGGNEVDVLFLDCCLGSSFELAWQIANVADYMMASETTGSVEVVHQPRDVLYSLSRDTSMTPRDVAELGYQAAINPQLGPSGFDYWGSAVLINLNLMSAPGAGAPGFMETFASFTDKIIDEFSYNSSVSLNLFKDIRNNCTTWGLESSQSMMVDLVDFLEQVVAFNQSLHYEETSTLASTLINWLTPGVDNIIIHEFYWYEDFTHLHGLSICLPDSYDMYQGFLWPNMYENLKINQETSWGFFINALYPIYDFKRFRLPDCYNIFVHPLDPVSQLHIYLGEDILPEPLHIGLSKDHVYEPGMGIEIGLESVEYHQDLLWGNTMISIPSQSMQSLSKSKAAGDVNFKVLIKTGSTTDTPRLVNLTIKHVVNDEIIWEENQVKEVQAGTVVSCQISNNSMTDFIIEEEPTTKHFSLISTKNYSDSIIVFFSFGFIILIAYRRKIKK